MADVPQAHVVHATPRRLRIRVPSKRRDAHFFSNVRSELSQQAGIESVEVNPLTASILIHGSNPGALLEWLQAEGPISIAAALSEAEDLSIFEQVRQRLNDWDTQIQRLTGSRYDTRVLFFLALAVSAGYQILRGDIFPPAATLLWYVSVALRFWGPADQAQLDSSTGAGAIDNGQ